MTEKFALMAFVQVVLALGVVAACPALWLMAMTSLREHLCRQHCRERKLMEAEAEPEADTPTDRKAA